MQLLCGYTCQTVAPTKQLIKIDVVTLEYVKINERALQILLPSMLFKTIMVKFELSHFHMIHHQFTEQKR